VAEYLVKRLFNSLKQRVGVMEELTVLPYKDSTMTLTLKMAMEIDIV
jgi:hypothetical protein